MKKLLVTGSGGLIGSECVKFFAEKGFEIVGIDNNMREYFFGPEASTEWNRKTLEEKYRDIYTHYNIDIRNNDEVEKVFKEHKFDFIIHTAAQPSHDWAAKEPQTDFSVNANGTLVMLENFRKYCPEAVFIFTSTNKVYGDAPNELPLIERETRFELSENHPFHKGIDESMRIDNSKHSIFGVSKVAADVMVQEYGKYFNLKTGVFRGGCLTGPSHSPAKLHGFLAYLVKCIATGQEYTILGYKGKQVRDNIHAYDVASMFWEYYQNPRCGEAYNMGGSRHSNVSMMEAIEKIENHLHRKGNIKYIDENRIGDHIWYVSDVSKFKKHYPNWEYKYDIDAIISELCEIGHFTKVTVSDFTISEFNSENLANILFPEKIFVSSHVSEAYGPVQALKSYLPKKFSNNVFIEHPFRNTGIEASALELSHAGLPAVRKNKKRFNFFSEAESYIYDFFLTLYWFVFKHRDSKVFIGINTLNALAGVLLKKMGFKFKLVYYSTDYSPVRFSDNMLKKIYRLVDRTCVRNADFVWSGSSRIAEMRKRRGLSDEKNICLGAGTANVDSEIQGYENDKNTLVFAGHLTREAGLDLIIKAMPKIVSKNSKAKLKICGIGPYKDQLDKLIRDNKLEQCVEIFPYSRPEQYYGLLKKSGIGLALYYIDKNDNNYYLDTHNVHDYLSCGLPVIINGSMAMADKIKNESLGLAIEFNEASFVEAVNSLVGSDEAYQKLYQNAMRERGKEKRWDEIFDEGFTRIFRGDMEKLLAKNKQIEHEL